MSDTQPAQIVVVYVEDEPFFAGTVSRMLTEAGYPTATANDGEAGLELIRRDKPGLVLLDLVLPKIDGKEVLKQLKADPATKDIPVIILSNLSAETEQKELRALGAEDFMVKAMTLPNEIVDKVKTRLAPAH